MILCLVLVIVYVFEIWLKLHLDYYKNLLQNTSDVIPLLPHSQRFLPVLLLVNQMIELQIFWKGLF